MSFLNTNICFDTRIQIGGICGFEFSGFWNLHQVLHWVGTGFLE
jgi:hypothetical protein